MLVRTGLDPAKAAAYSELYLHERQKELALFPEASEVIQKIGKKLPMGLITNGPADIQRLEIERLGIGDHFESILIEGEMGFGKPNPEVMRLAEKAMSASGSEILMVGNSAKHDIRPAQAAGWKTAWVRRASDVAPSSKTGAPETLPEGMKEPDLTMSTLSDLLDHLPLG
jgi:putative hydrolase of the HAD superfamily